MRFPKLQIFVEMFWRMTFVEMFCVVTAAVVVDYDVLFFSFCFCLLLLLLLLLVCLFVCLYVPFFFRMSLSFLDFSLGSAYL